MLAVISITQQGNKLARDVSQLLGNCHCYTLAKWDEPDFRKIDGRMMDFCKSLFENYSMLLFIMATGIVVRSIAHLINDKTTDPAIVVMDEKGLNVISLLSGHLGGANKLTELIARKIGANPVITTASDINNLPSVDMLALEYELIVESMDDAKTITSLIVNRKPIAVVDEYSILPDLNISTGLVEYEGSIVVTNKQKYFDPKPFVKLIPKNIIIGVGCKRGTGSDKLIRFICDVCNAENVDTKSIRTIASVSLKADERAIHEAAEFFESDIDFHEIEILQTVDHLFQGSDFVKHTVGVASVSTTAAYISGKKSGRFLIKKEICDGITVSVFEIKSPD